MGGLSDRYEETGFLTSYDKVRNRVALFAAAAAGARGPSARARVDVEGKPSTTLARL
jgi:hypothetical protein